MVKRILIEATHPEEVRVAIVDGSRLVDFDSESIHKKSIKGNVYLAKIVRVEPSLQAAFVDYGGNRHGFLPFSEIHPDYYRIPVEDRPALEEDSNEEESQESPAQDASLSEEDLSVSDKTDADQDASDQDLASPDLDLSDETPSEALSPEKVIDEAKASRVVRRYKIQEVIKSRQIVLIQVTKDERGTKGAALTTYVSLAGRYCVLMPNADNTGGVSRKITDNQDRKRLKEMVDAFELPTGMALIVRTAGLDRSRTEVKKDFKYLINLWAEIRENALKSVAPALAYEEADLINRSIRDLYARDIDEVIVEGEEAYKHAKLVMRKIMPSHAKKIQKYQDESVPLFFKYAIEQQISEIFQSQVRLKSGGYLVIHSTEALVAIDVNSGKSTKERHIDTTAFNTNLEAAEEVARQLRLRDLGGLIVIDFIDMADARQNAAVERRLKESLSTDRARIQIGRISMFGLIEMSRQRLKPSLMERSAEPCVHCVGTGFVRTPSTVSLQLLRLIEEELALRGHPHIKVLIPESIGFYLLNEKRAQLSSLEEKYKAKIELNLDSRFHNGFCLQDGEGKVLIATNAHMASLVAPADEQREAKVIPSQQSRSSQNNRRDEGRQNRGRRDDKKPEDRKEDSSPSQKNPPREERNLTPVAGADLTPTAEGVSEAGSGEKSETKKRRRRKSKRSKSGNRPDQGVGEPSSDQSPESPLKEGQRSEQTPQKSSVEAPLGQPERAHSPDRDPQGPSPSVKRGSRKEKGWWQRLIES